MYIDNKSNATNVVLHFFPLLDEFTQTHKQLQH